MRGKASLSDPLRPVHFDGAKDEGAVLLIVDEGLRRPQRRGGQMTSSVAPVLVAIVDDIVLCNAIVDLN